MLRMCRFCVLTEGKKPFLTYSLVPFFVPFALSIPRFLFVLAFWLKINGIGKVFLLLTEELRREEEKKTHDLK